MGAFLGSLAALSIGTSELFGRRISKTAGAIAIGVVIQGVATLTAAAAALTFVDSELIAGDMVRGAVSGVGYGLGITCYFAGLNRSSAAVIAPVVGTLAAVIPFTYSIATGAPASTLALIGAATAGLGLVLITSAPAATTVVRRGLPWALLGGLGYGAGQIAVIETSAASGAWPGAAQRGTAFVGLVAIALLTRAPAVPPPGMRRAGVYSGMGSGMATVFVLVGLHTDVVPTVVAAAMFPAVSVFVGWLIYRDHVTSRQVAGLVAALIGVGAVATG